MPYQIIRNDIVKMNVDAIVNPTDAVFSGSGGVDARVHFAAGNLLRDACDELPMLEMGEVAVTEGFNLPAKYVIHTFGPIWHGGKAHEKENLISCYQKSLQAAKEYSCETIAFPLISSGTFGYPKDHVLRVALETITDFLMSNDMTVFLIVYDRKSYEISKRLQADINTFIDEKYIARHDLLFDPYSYTYLKLNEDNPSDPAESKGDKVAVLASASKNTQSLSSMLSKMDESFSSMLLRLIDEKGMTDAECYKRANIDRRLFSKIRSNAEYQPKKTTVFAFAVALHLSVEETSRLLVSAGLSLTRSNKLDVILEYFLSSKKYNLMEINEALYQYGQPCLGNVIE